MTDTLFTDDGEPWNHRLELIPAPFEVDQVRPGPPHEVYDKVIMDWWCWRCSCGIERNADQFRSGKKGARDSGQAHWRYPTPVRRA